MNYVITTCLSVAYAMSAASAESIEKPADVAPLALERQASDLRDEFISKASEWLRQYDVPSVSVAYIVDGELAWTAAIGEQSPGVTADESSLYNIASMTKPLTAEAVLRLASENRLSLHEPMSEYWIDPDIKENNWHELLTPEISLSHQTGFTNWRYQTDGVLMFKWRPGSKTGYSGEGFEYVARFLEQKLDMPFDQLVREQVLKPLDMQETSWSREVWFAGRIAEPYGPDGAYGEPDYSSPWSAADNIYTTVSDYAKFMIAVMHNEGVSEKLAAIRFDIRDNVLETMDCPLEPVLCPLQVGFGLGWEVFAYEDETIVQHGGSDRGEKTLGFFIPEKKLGIIIFTNGANGDKVIRDTVELLHDNEAYTAFLSMQAG